MKLSVIGCGYLGAVHAAAMASIGHDVVGIDVDERKIDSLARGEAPFFEPGLPEILAEGIASGRLRFTTDMSEAARRRRALRRRRHAAAEGRLRGRHDLCQRRGRCAAAVPPRGRHRRRKVDGARRHRRRPVRAGRMRPARRWCGIRSSCAKASRCKDTVDPDRLVAGVPQGDAGRARRRRSCARCTTPPSRRRPRSSSRTTPPRSS